MLELGLKKQTINSKARARTFWIKKEQLTMLKISVGKFSDLRI
jgi:hypothetical protein